MEQHVDQEPHHHEKIWGKSIIDFKEEFIKFDVKIFKEDPSKKKNVEQVFNLKFHLFF
jgi:hypothetical protein